LKSYNSEEIKGIYTSCSPQNWIGKDAVLNHHKEVPFRLLKCNEKLSVGDDSDNLLVQGDNLEALKALLPYYAG
jgi:adenine-specific DNA-methyltransferase